MIGGLQWISNNCLSSLQFLYCDGLFQELLQYNIVTKLAAQGHTQRLTAHQEEWLTRWIVS